MSEVEPEPPAIWFTHIPRTGGTSLIIRVASSLDPDRMYPSKTLDVEQFTPKASVPYLLGIPRERLERTAFFCPHLPQAASALLDVDLYTMTMVRDPVDGMRSLLHMMKRSRADETMSLEAFFDADPLANGWMSTHQLGYYLGTTPEQLLELTTRPVMLAEASDLVDAYNQAENVVGTDDELVANACRALESIDVVGVTDEPYALHAAIEQRLGVPRRAIPQRLNASGGEKLQPSLERKIRQRVEADTAIYEFAIALIERRRTTEGRSTTVFGTVGR